MTQGLTAPAKGLYYMNITFKHLLKLFGQSKLNFMRFFERVEIDLYIVKVSLVAIMAICGENL